METIQWLSMFTGLLCIILIIDLFRRKEFSNFYLIPILVYLINFLIFYSARLLELHLEFVDFPNELLVFSKWSSILRFQGALTILAYMVILGNYDKKWIKFLRAKWTILLQHLQI